MSVEEQEQKDFNITKKIMDRIFSTYGARVEITPTSRYCAYDANMTVSKASKHKRYTIEIKERNVDSIEDLETLPLKVKKYCNIMEKTKEDETPLIIYLVNNSNYYIFNIKALDLNTLNLRNWTIAKMQYTDKRQYEEQPTFFIPIGCCIYNGIIN